MCDLFLVLEIDFPIFNRISSFYNLLKLDSGAILIIKKYINIFLLNN